MCLHGAEDPSIFVYASSIVRAARLGLPNTVELLGDEVLRRGLSLEEVVIMADRFPGGNLTSQAVQSGSLETLQQVVLLAEEADRDINAEALDPESGMCALHWAAAAKSSGMVLLLLESSSTAATAWMSVPSSISAMTPFQMYGDKHSSCFGQEQGMQHVMQRAEDMTCEHDRHSQNSHAADGMAAHVPNHSPGASNYLLASSGIAAVVAALLAGPTKCVISSVLVLAVFLVTVWYGWHTYCSVMERTMQLAASSGIELSWFMAPRDPHVEAQYCRFLLSRTSTLHRLLQATLPALLIFMAHANAASLHGPQLGWSSLAISVAAGCILVPMRQRLFRKGAARAIEWCNITVDLIVTCAFIISFAIPGLKGRQPGLRYPEPLVSLPVYVSIPYMAMISGVQAYSMPSPIRILIPGRLVNLILFIVEGYYSSLFSEPGVSLKVDWAIFLVSNIISSALYCTIRIKSEAASFRSFVRQSEKARKA